MEVELKLTISDDDQKKLRQHRLLSSISPSIRQVRSVYFDTPEKDLLCLGCALRLRDDGGKKVQTLKTSGSVKDGLHERDEWEMPIANDKPQLELFPNEWRERLKPFEQKLQPIFITDFERSSWKVCFQDNHFSLDCDKGVITSGELSEPISELEIELIDGKREGIIAFAQELKKTIPSLRPFNASKAERGYRLFIVYKIN